MVKGIKTTKFTVSRRRNIEETLGLEVAEIYTNRNEGYLGDKEQLSPNRRLASISTILRHMQIPKVDTALDIGTGFGYGAVMLNRLGAKGVLGVESNKDKLLEGVRFWKEQGIPVREISCASDYDKASKGIYFLNQDARKLEGLSQFDLITSFYISSYMLQEGVFQDIAKLLLPQGQVIVSTDGPSELPPAQRGEVVRQLEKKFRPKGLVLDELTELTSPHDRYVISYRKTA